MADVFFQLLRFQSNIEVNIHVLLYIVYDLCT